jgi:hypothetical protein
MNRRLVVAGLAVAAGAGLWQWLRREQTLSLAEWERAYAVPLAAPEGPLMTYHLGHSLVGRDMPTMLAMMAGHRYHSQLGWGASLSDHWKETVNGFEAENAHLAHRPVREALQSGDYDAVIFTEMVELKDAIRYHDSAARLADWARLARAARPDVRLYLYETWHRLDDAVGWLDRIDNDLSALWVAKVLRPAMAQEGVGTIHLIPAGQVMAAAVRAAEAGSLPGITDRRAFFTDDIHLSDLGHWLVAATHFAVLYHRKPFELPGTLARADGTAVTLPDAKSAIALQELVWQVVTGYPATGVAAKG